MTYVTGTITDANPGVALHAVFASALTANGYTLDDTVVISTSTYKIYKNPAANNGSGFDWYFMLRYTTTGAGTLSFNVMEVWTAVTDLMQGFVSTYSPSQTVSAPNYRIFETAIALDGTAGQSGLSSISITSSSFGYWISITPTRINFLLSTAPTQVYCAGLYDADAAFATAAGAALLPLGRWSVGPSVTEVGVTRVPGLTGSVSPFVYGIIPAPSTIVGYFNVTGVPAGSTVFGPRRGNRIPVSAGTSNSSSGFFGYIKDALVVAANNTVARGDTVTIGADTWILSTNSGSNPYYCTAFKAV